MLAILFFAAVFPVIVLTAFHALQHARYGKQQSVNRLQEAASAIAEAVQLEMERYRGGVTALARQLENCPEWKPESLQKVLSDTAGVYPEFLTMLLIDRDGVVVAEKSKRDTPGISLIGSSVSDREYFREALRKKRPFVSDAFRGRGFGTDPIVAVSAPGMKTDGQAFVVEGSLNLFDFARLERRYKSIPGERILIVDSKKHVLYASSFLGIRPLADVSGSKIVNLQRKSGGAPFIFSDEEGPMNIGHAAIEPGGWHVYIGQPLSYALADTRVYYRISILAGLAGILLALLLAYRMDRLIANPVRVLAKSSRNLILEGEEPELAVSRMTPLEIAGLVDDLTLYNQRMKKVLSGVLPICASCKSIRDEDGDWIRIEAYMDSRTEVKLTHGLCPDCARKLYPKAFKPKG